VSIVAVGAAGTPVKVGDAIVDLSTSSVFKLIKLLSISVLERGAPFTVAPVPAVIRVVMDAIYGVPIVLHFIYYLGLVR
jgi:hypothetical protein